MRFDITGTGTGILYRVLSIGEEREYLVRRHIRGYNMHILKLTRKVKLKPAIVVFESKLVANRANVTHYMCDLRPISIVEMGTEYTKLGLMIQDEVRRLAGEHQDRVPLWAQEKPVLRK